MITRFHFKVPGKRSLIILTGISNVAFFCWFVLGVYVCNMAGISNVAFFVGLFWVYIV